jgi:hypothetical protein
MRPPEEVKLSREDGEALIERIKASHLASDDQGLLVKLIRVYFWLALALHSILKFLVLDRWHEAG